MPEYVRTDEVLAQSCANGDNSAFDELFQRYAGRVRAFLLWKSWYRDDDQYIDELVEQAFEVAWQCLKDRKFKSQGDGSFLKWLLGICQLECYMQDIGRSKLPKTTSTLFPASYANIPLPVKKEVSPEDELLKEEEIHNQLKEALSKLTPEEQKLMQMVADKVPYKDILKEPEFSNYTLDYIRRKIYTIRQRFKGR